MLLHNWNNCFSHSRLIFAELQLLVYTHHFSVLFLCMCWADPKDAVSPQLQLEFKCFLIDHKTNKHIPVSSVVTFWIFYNWRFYCIQVCIFKFGLYLFLIKVMFSCFNCAAPDCHSGHLISFTVSRVTNRAAPNVGSAECQPSIQHVCLGQTVWKRPIMWLNWLHTDRHRVYMMSTIFIKYCWRFSYWWAMFKLP